MDLTPRAVTEYDLRSFLFDLYPRKVRDAAYRAEAMPVSLGRFFEFLQESEGIVCAWAGPALVEREERGPMEFPEILP